MSPIRMSKIEGEIRVVLEFKEAFNRHDVPGLLALMSEDIVFESAQPAPGGATYTGKEAVGGYWQDFFRAWPQAHLEGEDTFTAFGKRLILRWKCFLEGKDGDQKAVRGVDIFQVRGGHIADQLSYIKG